jgi:dihydroxyacetone kinase-like protein
MFAEAARLLDRRGIVVERVLVGPYVTSLDMSGCSLTVVRLDDELTELWDAPVRTPALTW